MIELKSPTRQDAQHVRVWRNENIAGFRTPYLLTQEQQDEFFDTCINNRSSWHRYFSFYDGAELVAFGGITHIEWENRMGEISLIVNPGKRGKGMGADAVDILLRYAFDVLNLEAVFAECYGSNKSGWEFWCEMAKKYSAKTVVLPKRKFWDGTYYPSLYVSFDRGCTTPGLVGLSQRK